MVLYGRRMKKRTCNYMTGPTQDRAIFFILIKETGDIQFEKKLFTVDKKNGSILRLCMDERRYGCGLHNGMALYISLEPVNSMMLDKI